MASRNEPIISPKLALLFSSLRSSPSISTHRDFYRWLQSDVGKFLPHETLLAAWGNFETGQLDYDISSAHPDVDTSSLLLGPDVAPLMANLFSAARQSPGGRCNVGEWTEITDGYDADDHEPAIAFLNMGISQGRSILAYAMRNEREDYDCLYLFASLQEKNEIDFGTVDLLMPHVDTALRRVKCLKLDDDQTSTDNSVSTATLSGREREVMNWVSKGKSNTEIGSILGISPNTVKNHLKRIFGKMGVSARAQAVRVYIMEMR